jgi:hypothetical protein
MRVFWVNRSISADIREQFVEEGEQLRQHG